jgi:hypothetical protein
LPPFDFDIDRDAFVKVCANPRCGRVVVGTRDQSQSAAIFEEFLCRDPFTDDGLTSWCRSCRADVQNGRQFANRDDLLASQDGRCAITACNAPISFTDRTANVDHDHTNGRTRGVVCVGCNARLSVIDAGQSDADERWTRAAISYRDRRPTTEENEHGS